MTTIHAQAERKRQDRSVCRAEKRLCRARMLRVRGLIHPTSAVCATTDTARGEKRLPSEQNQAILKSSGRPLGECRLKVFGEALFGSEDYFDRSERYTLDPLRELGPDSMAHGDVEGIAGVRFVEFGRRWPGKISEMEIRKCEDLFKSFDENWEKRLTGGSFTHATFKFAFKDSKKERSVTIRPANIARYERDSDEEVIEAWLKARGFWAIPAGADGDEDFEVLEDA